MFDQKLFKQPDEWTYSQLTWLLLEFKFAYYYPASLHDSWKKSHIVPDVTYDMCEDLSKSLATKLGKQHGEVVGFSFDTPSGRLVASKLSQERTNDNCPMAIMKFIGE